MEEPVAYLNGRVLPQAKLRIPAHDAGFVLGATVTDLCRTFGHRLFRFPDHLERFSLSCRYAQIQPPLSDAELSQIAEQVVAHNALLLQPEEDLALVLFATPGPIGYYAGQEGGAGDGEPTFGLHTFPLPFSRYFHLFQEGAHLVVPSIRQVPAATLDPRVKQRSRMHWWLAGQQAQTVERNAIALLMDATGHITETAAANVLLVRDRVVLSPPMDTILGGISLQTVRELCDEIGIGFQEQPFTLYDCLAAEEAMLTSTPYCLAGVSQVNGVALPWPGSIFLGLLEAWSRRVGVDIRRQIFANR
jgi:branched-subunit amino acid aminotransferase/4-amino-4-deoxychorismate lyase